MRPRPNFQRGDGPGVVFQFPLQARPLLLILLLLFLVQLQWKLQPSSLRR